MTPPGAAPAAPRPAATVVVLRPHGDGLAVFLVKRNRRVGFMPSAWVFPGGRVDTADALVDHPRLTGGQAAADAMGLSLDEAVPFLAAAVRETFEESGIWLGEGSAPQSARDALNAREATLAEVLDAHELRADLDALVPWSWWVTPLAEPRRYDTRFFLALVDTEDGRHDDGETVQSAWMPLSEAAARADAGDLPMAPPTWWTLRELAALRPAQLRGGGQPHRPICPVLRGGSEDLRLVLPGHVDHPDDPVPGLPSEVRFHQGRWWTID